MVLGWVVVVALERQSTVGWVCVEDAMSTVRGGLQLHLGESPSQSEWVRLWMELGA